MLHVLGHEEREGNEVNRFNHHWELFNILADFFQDSRLAKDLDERDKLIARIIAKILKTLRK